MRYGWVGIIAACLAAASSGANALGLSDISVDSRLNQPLVATLRLSTLSADEAESLQVQLASAEEYEKAGMTLTDFVAGLRFAVSGNLVRISSQQSAREPMLSLLVEARAGSSRVLRGYTVLLDLPAPSVTDASTPAAPAGDRQYGPVKPGETFWSVATRLRPDPALVSMDQTLLALYTANPEAFFGGINGLLTGAVLSVPSLEQMRSVPDAEAHRRIAALRAGPTAAPTRPAPKLVAVSPPPPPPAPAPAPAATPAVAAVAEPLPSPPPAETAAPAVPSTPTPAAESPVTASDAAAMATPPATGAPVDAVVTDAATADPQAEPAPTETVAAAEPPAEPPVEPAVPPTAELPVEAPAPAPGIDRATAGSIWAWLTAPLLLLSLGVLWRRRQAEVAAPRIEPSSATAALAEGAEAAESSTGDAEPTEAAADAPAEPQPAPETQADTAVAAEAVAAVEPSAEPALYSDATATADPDVPASAAPSAFESLLIDPDLPQGADEIDLAADSSAPARPSLDQIDPLAEAEFHLSYGLYDEAVRGLLDAMVAEPDRNDLAVKLAETYFAAGRPDDFETLAQQLQFRLSPGDWSRLTFMGAQLCPESALFRDPASMAPTTMGAAPAVPEFEAAAVNRIDFALDEPAPWSASVAAPAPADAGGHRIDFALNPTAVSAPAAGAMPALDLSNPQTIPVEDLMALDPDDVNLFEPEPESELATDDEVGTKLDLARAYIDMGDTQMARDLLGEVAQQGTPAQQADAQLLLLRLPA